jgi:hypothetical protein
MPKEDPLDILLCPSLYKMILMMLNITFLLGLLAPRLGPRRVPRHSRVHPCAPLSSVAFRDSQCTRTWMLLRWRLLLYSRSYSGTVQHGENDRARVHAAQVATIKKESGHRDATKVAAWHASHIP